MSLFPLASRIPALLAFPIALALAAGCNARTDEAEKGGTSEENISRDGAAPVACADPDAGDGGAEPCSPCARKACGVDCTPAGSDEPFNCNAAGACVPTGEPLDCKACPAFLGDCVAGQAPADLDGDGCIDGCK